MSADINGIIMAREEDEMVQAIHALPWVVPGGYVVYDRNSRKTSSWKPRNAGTIVSLKCSSVCGRRQMDQKGSSTVVTPFKTVFDLFLIILIYSCRSDVMSYFISVYSKLLYDL